MNIPRTKENCCGLTTHLSLLHFGQQYTIIKYLIFNSLLKFKTHANLEFLIFIAFRHASPCFRYFIFFIFESSEVDPDQTKI